MGRSIHASVRQGEGGEWTADSHEVWERFGWADQRKICECQPGTEEGRENAVLFAQARELRDALAACLSALEAEHANLTTGTLDGECDEEINQARAVLAKVGR